MYYYTNVELASISKEKGKRHKKEKNHTKGIVECWNEDISRPRIESRYHGHCCQWSLLSPISRFIFFSMSRVSRHRRRVKDPYKRYTRFRNTHTEYGIRTKIHRDIFRRGFPAFCKGAKFISICTMRAIDYIAVTFINM